MADVYQLRPDLPNSEIIDAVRNAASTDYQLRIPAADKAGISQTVEALMDPNNRRWRNEFVDVLVNRIGMTILRNNSWSNPLAAFKRGLLEFGSTIEEIQVGLLKAHNYSPDRDYMEETLFGRELPEVQANFHTVNRQDFYKVTVNEAMLKRAFLETSGLMNFCNQLMEAPTTSDQWDEFLLMSSLFREYESNGGFYKVNVPNVSDYGSDAADAKLALRKMRAMADNLKFLSTKYNAAHMPSFAKPEDILMFSTPEFMAAIDVEALSAAFNISRAEAYGRFIPIPKEHFGITDCQAILTTKEFFVMADSKFESTSQNNAASLHQNYFLHHWEIISCSRFAPAVMFTTGADDEVIMIHNTPSGITIAAVPDWTGTTPTGIVHGGIVGFSAVVAPSNADQGVVWSISGQTSSGTYISQDGVVHCGYDETATTLTVTAATTDINPDTPYTAPVTQTFSLTVSDAPVVQWPNSTGTITAIKVDGSAVPSFAPGTHTYAITLPATDENGNPTVVDENSVEVDSVGPVDVNVTVSGPVGSPPVYTITIATENSEGAAIVTYTVTATVG
jgi:hypothetical protein